mmetsp:Transcript_41180/g.99205  ORF Transcript_41180/g.99205 Transcript_41180/m.99205 type:complete len:211 (+) Transcript_41180:1441-2073(+)
MFQQWWQRTDDVWLPQQKRLDSFQLVAQSWSCRVCPCLPYIERVGTQSGCIRPHSSSSQSPFSALECHCQTWFGVTPWPNLVFVFILAWIRMGKGLHGVIGHGASAKANSMGRLPLCAFVDSETSNGCPVPQYHPESAHHVTAKDIFLGPKHENLVHLAHSNPTNGLLTSLGQLGNKCHSICLENPQWNRHNHLSSYDTEDIGTTYSMIQ